MEARPALSIPRSGEKQLSNIGVSGTHSSALPVRPNPSDEVYPKLPDFQQVSVERELMTRPFTNTSHVPSNSGVVGHIFSSSSGFSSDLHYSSVSPHEKQSRNAPFLPQSASGTSLSLPHTSHSGMLQSTTSGHYAKENSDSWCTDSITGFLDYPVNTPVENSQVESGNCGSIMASEEFTKRNDWQEWADQLITDDDALESNWNELLVDTNISDMEPKVGLLMHVALNIHFASKVRKPLLCL